MAGHFGPRHIRDDKRSSGEGPPEMTWMGTEWGGFPTGGSVPSQCKGPGGGRGPGQSGKVSDEAGSWRDGWRQCTGAAQHEQPPHVI